MSHLGPWHLGKASSLQLSKTLICISLPRLLLEISSSGRWVGGRRIGGEGGRALTLHAPALRQHMHKRVCPIPLGKYRTSPTVLRMLNLPQHGAGADGGSLLRLPGAWREAAGRSRSFGPGWHSWCGITKGMWITVKNVSSVCPSAGSHLLCRDGQQVCSLDATTGPCRMPELKQRLGCMRAGAAAAGTQGSASWDTKILQIPL